MDYSKHIFKIAYAFLLLLPLWAKAIGPCDDALNKNPTMAEIEQKYEISAARGSNLNITDNDLKVLWQSGWAELARMAHENDTSISDILSFYREKQAFLNKNLIEIDDNLRTIGRYSESDNEKFKDAALLLEPLTPRDKFKKKHWDALRALYILFYRLRAFVVAYDIATKEPEDKASIDPFAPLTGEQIKNLLDALEDIVVDDTLLEFTLWAQESIKARQILSLDRPQVDNQETTQPQVIPATLTKPLYKKPERNQDTNDLAMVLKSKLPLHEDRVYQAKTIRDQVLSIYIDKSIVRDDHGGDGQVIRRLLRSIIIGRGDKSGIKMLADLGPQIVELKAVFHGHKRIIGCLEGSKLTLKYLIDIKDSKATYSKRINPRLCL